MKDSKSFFGNVDLKKKFKNPDIGHHVLANIDVCHCHLLASWSGTDSPTVLTQSPPWWSWKHPQHALVGCTCVSVCVLYVCIRWLAEQAYEHRLWGLLLPLHAPPLQYLYLWEPAPSMLISPFPSIFCLLHCKTRISSFIFGNHALRSERVHIHLSSLTKQLACL